MATTITMPTACARSFDGTRASICQARAWVREVLPAGCGRVDDVLLVVSELVTNAILHSASGEPGGRYALQLEVNPPAHSVGVTCIDMGPALAPAVRQEGEGGRGLTIVKKLAATYEMRAEPTSRTVCCWLDWAAEQGGGA
ncbi:histidine kinase-like protein [Nonomuraea polychroma]|uniref:Histidine kinase-like protein n=1 Tax=Nonomuraea polychroma TaxID=46176 RepID=A0A438M0X1_9ACTN|nr:ATP-binding protein [Nonomuraea polychroma]RVX39128.1 histidine kinase-like protein [Nonomuraea polychroma]